jgi:hypothetical protein
MAATTQSELDDVARMEYTSEQARHVAALAAIRPGDADGIAAEFNWHLDRVHKILDDFGQRMEEQRAAVCSSTI